MATRLVFCLFVAALLVSRAGAAFSPGLTFDKGTYVLVSCVDYDKDGYTDIINGMAVLHNEKNGTFRQVATIPMHATPISGWENTAWVDFDNDGIRDVLVQGNLNGADRINRVTVIVNGVPLLGGYHDILGWDVPPTSQTAPETYGPTRIPTRSTAIADFNRDGKLDIYLARNKEDLPDEIYGKDWLVKNTTVGAAISMLDITNDVGMTRQNQYCPDINGQQFRWAEGAGLADYNYDGYPDIFVGTYRCKCNFLWKGGYGSTHGYACVNPAEQNDYQSSTGVNLSNINTGDYMHGNGVYWFDYDNDGYLDLMEARLSHYTSAGALKLWHNNKNGTFTDTSSLLPQVLGVSNAQHYKCIAAGDYDNDGDTDVYVGRSPQYSADSKNDFPASARGRLLKNNLVETGSPSFTDVTASENLDNADHADMFGAAFIDYNNDGKLDLFTSTRGSAPDSKQELWRNDGAWTGHWLWVQPAPPQELNGVKINRDAIGAVVQIWIDKNVNGQMDSGEILTRQQMAYDTGCLWQGPVALHFGLGPYTPSNVRMEGRVFWPGVIDGGGNPVWVSFSILGVDRTITVGQGTVAAPTLTPHSQTFIAKPATITMACSTPEAAIHYTINGGVPTESDAPYTAPVTISSKSIIKARAFKEGWEPSACTTEAYDFATLVATSPELSAAGLLVRVWGRVTFVANDGSYAYIDDGAGVQDGTGKTGVRIALSGQGQPLTRHPEIDHTVAITGLAGMTQANGVQVRVIRPRNDSDITLLD